MIPRGLAFAAVALAAAAGCAPARPPLFVPTQPTFASAREGFEVVPPPGWMRVNADDALVITRDGTPLQRIVVSSSPVGKPVELGEGKRVVQAGMTPQELAELVVDDLRASERVTAVRVVESAPATLSGRPGFRVVAAYVDPRGLARRVAVYGLLDGSRFYRLFLIAPERVYFPRDLPVLDELARTFRVREPAR